MTSHPSYRIALQVLVGVLLILVPCSPTYVWSQLTVSPVYLSPANAAVLYVYGTSISAGFGLNPVVMASYIFLGNLLGASLGMGLSYLVYLINGCSFEPNAVKAAASMVLTAIVVFILCCERFKRHDQDLMGRYAVMGVALQMVGGYSGDDKTPMQYFLGHVYNLVMAAAAILLTRTFVAPVTTGEMCRGALASALEGLGKCVRETTSALATDAQGEEEAEQAKESEAGPPLSQEAVDRIYSASQSVEKALTLVRYYEPYAAGEPEFFRAQRWFPLEGTHQLAVLTRGALSSWMMTVYPLQTGQATCALAHRLGATLETVADEVGAVLTQLADCLRDQADAGDVPAKLDTMDAAFEELLVAMQDQEAAEKGNSTAPSPADVAVLSTLLVLQSTVERMAAGLPKALGRNGGPGATSLSKRFTDMPMTRSEASLLCISEIAAAHKGPTLSIDMALTGLVSGLQRSVSRGAKIVASAASSLRGPLQSWPLALVPGLTLQREASLHLAQDASARLASGTEPSKERMAAIDPEAGTVPASKRVGACVPPQDEAETLTWRERCLKFMMDRFGYSPIILAQSFQGASVVLIISGLNTNQRINDATAGKLPWALFIAISLMGSVIGSITFKAWQRMLGTVVGIAYAVAFTYFTVLVNGLSAQVTPVKIAVLILSAAAGCFLGSYVGYHMPQYGSATTIAATCIVITIMGPSHLDWLDPMLFTWRLAATAFGVVVELSVTSLVFPVTGRDIIQAKMLRVLEHLAEVLDETVELCCTPEEIECGGARRGSFIRRALGGSPAKGDSEQSGCLLCSAPCSWLARLGHRTKTVVLHWLSPPLRYVAGVDLDRSSVVYGRQLAIVPGKMRGSQSRRQLRHAVLGNGARKLELDTADLVKELTELKRTIGDSAYEYYPLRKPHRLPVESLAKLHRLLDQLVNVCFSMVALLETQDLTHVDLNQQQQQRARRVGLQMRQTLLTFCKLIRGKVTVQRATEQAARLETMARALFLSVAADEDAVTAPEEMVNLTFLSRLLNAAHITQALLVSLLQSSYIDDPELESTVQRLTSTLRWEWEDEIFVGIVLILAPCSPSYVWNRLTVHWLFLSPANAAVLYVFGGSIRLRHGVTPLLMASYTFLGGLFGSTLGMVLSYLIYFINGRSFETTTTKAVTSMIFAPLATFLLCCERFKRRDQETLGRYAVLGVALQIVGSYGNTSATPLRYFTAQLYNLAMASVALLLTRTLVAPVTTGEFCRRSMANALEQLGVCVRATIDAMAANKEALGPDGEPAPAALAEADLKVVHTAATAVAKGLTLVRYYEPYAASEPEFYRAQRWFPLEGHHQLAVLTRGALSSWMMTVYPLQTGQATCALAHRLGQTLSTVASEIEGALALLADCLRDSADPGDVPARLDAVDAAFIALLAALQDQEAGAGAPGSPADVAVLSTLLVMQSTVERLAAGLPKALGRNGGLGAQALAQYLATKTESAEEKGADIKDGAAAALGSTLLPCIEATLSDLCIAPARSLALDAQLVALTSVALRAQSFSPRGTGRTPSLVHHRSLGSPAKLEATPATDGSAPPAPAPPSQDAERGAVPRPAAKHFLLSKTGRCIDRCLTEIDRRCGYDRINLAQSLQGAVVVAVIFGLSVNRHIREATDYKLPWALFIAIGLMGSVVGGVLRKCVYRVGATLAGIAWAVAFTYFTVLLNGLSAHATPAKIVLSVLWAALGCSVASLLGCRWPRASSGTIIGATCVVITIMAPSHSDHVDPMLFVWRLAATAFGILVEVASTALVFPVSGRTRVKAGVRGVLEHLAEVLDETVELCCAPAAKLEGERGPEAAGKTGPVQPRKALDAGEPRQSPWPVRAWDWVSTFVLHWLSPPKRYVAGVDVRQPSPLGAPHLTLEPGKVRGSRHQRRMRHAVFGTGAKQLELDTEDLIGKLASLKTNADHASFEYHPTQRVKRLPVEAVGSLCRLLDQLVNVCFSMVTLLEAQGMSHVQLSAEQEQRARRVGLQMRQTLLGFRELLRRKVSIAWASDQAARLENMARALFLSVAADTETTSVQTPEEMVTLTFLSRLLNAAHITQALLVALLQSSYINEPEIESAVQRLTSRLRWEWEDELRTTQSKIWVPAPQP